MTERLLRALRRRTNHRDLVIVQETTLLDELRTTPEALRDALRNLAADGLVEVLSPLPFLVTKWSGKGWKAADSAGSAYSFQSSLSRSKHLKESYRHPAVDEQLLEEVLDTLGETDPTTFRGALRRYPPGVIRTALARIRGMKNIQKNPTAVFRFLLPRIASEPAFKK
jgi:hypothetical protein